MFFQNITLHELEEIVRKKENNIFCFGAGRAFDDFFGEFKNWKLIENIKGIADNNYNEKSYCEKIIYNIIIPIISVEQMLQSICAEDMILITTASYHDVVLQLEQIDNLKNIDYCLYFMLKIRQNDQERLQITIPTKLSVYNELRIPKVIHYCWFGKKEIPIQYQKWMETWKRFCPDYKIIEWNEDNYDIEKNRYISEAYENEMWAFVSDYVRIDVVNKYGGVYLDTDIELVKNIDELLMNDAFCGFESSEYVAFGLGFGAIKGNKILAEIKDYYDNTSFILADGTFNIKTCPVIQTEILKRHGLKCDGTFQVVDGITILPSRILCGMSPHSFRVEKNPVYNYAIHHYTASWAEQKLFSYKQTVRFYLEQGKADDDYCHIE